MRKFGILTAMLSVLMVGVCNAAVAVGAQIEDPVTRDLSGEAHRELARSRPAANVRSGRGHRVGNRRDRRAQKRIRRGR